MYRVYQHPSCMYMHEERIAGWTRVRTAVLSFKYEAATRLNAAMRRLRPYGKLSIRPKCDVDTRLVLQYYSYLNAAVRLMWQPRSSSRRIEVRGCYEARELLRS